MCVVRRAQGDNLLDISLSQRHLIINMRGNISWSNGAPAPLWKMVKK